jgi:hypothetical protein
MKKIQQLNELQRWAGIKDIGLKTKYVFSNVWFISTDPGEKNHNLLFVKNLANSSMKLSKPLLQQKN